MNIQEADLSKTSKLKRNAFIKREVAAWALFAPFLFLVFAFVWYPQVKAIVLSLFKMQGYTPIEFNGFQNYVQVFHDTLFPKILGNTFKYVFWSMIIGYIPPIVIAIMLNEIVHFQNGLKTCIYFPVILPAVAAYLMWYLMYFPDEGGLLNMILSYFKISPQQWLQDKNLAIPLMVVAASWKGMPATMILYLAALQGVNRELYEAATLDGAGPAKRLFNVTFPQIIGVMLLMLIKQIISVFQVLEQPMTMTGGGPSNSTLTMAYWAYKEGFENFRVGSSMAIGNILFLIILVFTLFYFYLSKKTEDWV